MIQPWSSQQKKFLQKPRKLVGIGLLVVGAVTLGVVAWGEQTNWSVRQTQVSQTTATPTPSPTPDITPPSLIELKNVQATSAQVTLKEVTLKATSSAVASQSAKSISITDTRATAVSFTLSFSEVGTLHIEPVKNLRLDWVKEPSAEPVVTLPAGQPPFKTSYLFTDLAGLSTSGELNYFYDNKPPAVKLISPLNTTNKWGSSFGITFTFSEPTKSFTVTFKGQTVPTHLDSFKNNVAMVELEIGQNPFSITATDLNGNTGTQSFTINQTQDPDPVDFPPKAQSSFRKCSDADHDACYAEVGGPGAFLESCDKFYQYRDCLEKRCDNTVSHNQCP